MSFRKFGGLQRSNVSNVVSNNILSTNTLLVTTQVGKNNSKIDIKSELDVQNNVNITGNLTVIGNEDLSGNKIVRGDLDVLGNTIISGNLNVEKDSLLIGNLEVSKNSLIKNNLTVDKNTKISGQLTVTGNSYLNKTYIDTLDVSNNVLIRGNQIILKDSAVAGNQYINNDCNIGNDLTVTNNIFTNNLNATSNGNFGKNIDVSGNLYVGDILDVSSNAIIRNNINILKDALINNDLSVLGNAIIEEHLALFSGDLTAPYLNDNITALMPKSYIDSVASGLRITGPCYCATIGQIDLSGSVLSQTSQLDFELEPGKQLRILIKNQNNGSDLYPSLENGIYIADLSGNSNTNPTYNSWYRAPNMVDGTNVTAATTFIFYGVEYARSVFVQTVGNINNPALIGETAIQWTLFRVINLTLGKGLEYLNNTDTIQVDAGEGLTFDGNALIVDPNLVLKTLLTSGNVTIKGQLNVDQATALKNTLTVSDSTYLNNTLNLANNLQINNTKFQVLAQEGNTIVGGYLNVYGLTSLSNGLVVNGNTTINGNLSLNDLTMNNLTVNSATINSILNLFGNFNINNEFTVNGVNGNTLINGTLSVPNNITNLNTLNTSSDTTVKGILNVIGQSNLSGGLNSGSTSVTSLSVINNSSLYNLFVSGDANLYKLNVGSNGINYFSVLGTNGNTTINGTLTVPSGDTKLYSLSAKNTSIDGTLDVSGNTNLKTLKTSSNTTIEGQLNVTGSGTFSQEVIMKSGVLSSDVITDNPNGLVSKSYVDTMLNGIKPTGACYCTTIGQINIYSSVTSQFGKLDIKTVLPTGFSYRVLLKNQANNGTTDPSEENGIYIADLSGNSTTNPTYNTWYRAPDMDIETIVTSVTTFIEQGNLYKFTTFYQNQGSNANPAIIGITPIAWSIFSSNNIQAGPGITFLVNTLSVDNGSSLTFTGNQLIVNPNLSLTTLSTIGNLEVGSNLNVTGQINLSSNLNIKNINTNTFTVTSATGNTNINGTLTTVGDTSLSTLSTTGLATLNSAKIGNNFNINSTGDLTINSTKFTITALSGNTNIGGTFQVVGTTNLSNDFYINYNTINKFKVIAQTGDTTIAGNLVVNGDGNTTFNTVTIKNPTITGKLNVTGETTLSAVNMGNTTLNGSLTAKGISNFNNNFYINDTNNINKFQVISSNGDTTISGQLNVQNDGVYSGNLQMLSGVLTSSSITTNPNGLVPKSYVDTIASGIKVAGPCYCATKGLINLSGTVTGQITNLDINSLSSGEQYRILVKNQANGSDTIASKENGIYIADLSNSSPYYNKWYRAPNMEVGSNITSTSSFVGYGNIYDKSVFIVQKQDNTTEPVIVGITPFIWVPFRVIDVEIGPGLKYNENVIEVDAGSGLSFNGNQLIVNPNLSLTSLNTTGNINASGNLYVIGETNLSNNLNINTDKFQVIATSGNTSIGGTLNISGNTDLSTLSTSGLATLNSSTILGVLNVNGETTFYNNLTVNGINSHTIIGGSLSVTGESSLSILSISGNAEVGGNLNVSSDTTLSKNLTVNGTNTNINGILNVIGNSILNTLSTSNTTINGTLGVSNETTLNNNLIVNGSSNLSILNTSGNTTHEGNLNVKGISTLSNNLYINDINGVNQFNIVNSSGNTTINGTLNVKGISTFENELHLQSGILTGPLTTLENGLVPKSYVDSLSQGLKPFLPCYCTTTGIINLSGNVNTQYSSLDVNSLTAGQQYRILVKNQAAGLDTVKSVQNGIYIADLSGNSSTNPTFNTWYRAPDMNTGTNVNSATTFINYGNQYSNTTFYQTQGTSTQPAIIGSTAIKWTILSSSQLNVGNGLSYINNVLSVNAGNGLGFNGNQLIVSPDLSLTTLSTSGLATFNSASINTTLYVNGATTLNSLTTLGSATLNSASITTSLGVNGDFSVNTNKFQIIATSGNTNILGTLGVNGLTSLSTLTTSGQATLNSSTINNDLQVIGNSSLKSLTTSELATLNSASITTTLGVSGNFSVNNNKFQVNASNGNTNIDGTLDVSGNTTISNTLNVTGANTTLTSLTTSDLATLNSAKIGNNFNVSTSGNLSVNTSKFQITASNGNTSIAGTLLVSGATTLSSTLGVTSATTLFSTLDVSGNTLLKSGLSVSGGTILSNTLDVTSATTLFSTLDVSGDTLLKSGLSVSGATILSNTLNVVGDFSVNTNKFKVNASNGNTDISGNLNLVSGVLTSSTITSNPNGLVPKSYVDTLASGLKIAGPCYCATIGQIDLSGNVTSQTNKLDYQLTTSEQFRILVKNQGTGGSDTIPSKQNGIYIADLSGNPSTNPTFNTWYRAPDMLIGDNVTSTTTFVGYGTLYAKTIFVQNQGSTSSPAIVGTTPLEWVIFRQVEIKLGPGLEFSITNDTIQVKKGLTMNFDSNNALIVNPNLNLTTLTTTGLATLNSATLNSASISNSLKVSGNTTLSTLDVNGTSTLGQLTANDNTTLNGKLEVKGTTTLYNSLTVSGKTTVTSIEGIFNVNSLNVSATGNLTANGIIDNGNTTLNGKLEVKGTTTLNKNLTVGTNCFTVDTENGLTQLQKLTITSDYRIKENVKPLDDGFTVDNLYPVSYKNKITNCEDLGLIAHQLQEIYPQLVNGEKDEVEFQTVNYIGLIPILINEIKQMKKDNKMLREKLKEKGIL